MLTNGHVATILNKCDYLEFLSLKLKKKHTQDMISGKTDIKGKETL